MINKCMIIIIILTQNNDVKQYDTATTSKIQIELMN